MTRDQFISFCFIALLVFVVYQVFLIFAPFFSAIFWSVLLAFGSYPLYEKLRRWLAPRDTLAAMLVTGILFFTILPLLIYIIINVTSQAIELYQSVSDYIRAGSLEKLIDRVRTLSAVQFVEQRLGEWQILQDNLSRWLLGAARAVGNIAANQAATATKNAFFLILNLFLMTFLVFAFLRDGAQIYNFIYQIAPLEEKNKKPIFRRINETLAAVIRGQLLTAIVQAILAGFIFWLLGLPIPIFFAMLTFITAMIPVVGAATIWFPLVVYLVARHENIKAAVLFIFGSLVISLIDNILKPALIGEKTKLPYLLLLFGILGGVKLYGLVGIFLAPVMLSLFFALAKIYDEKNW